jgi:hypothetical protein
MYPTEELTELGQRKVAVRVRIAASRREAVVHAGEVRRPIDRIDHLLAQWRRISPFVKAAIVPLGLLWRRRLTPRRRRLSRTVRILRWAPLVLRAVRLFALQR